MKITAPSGTTYDWTRPPRHVHWRHGRIGQRFYSKVEEFAKAAESGEMASETDDERGLRLFESLSADEASRLEAYVNDVIAAGLKRRLSELSDIPEGDYWFLFGQSVYSAAGTKVETTEGETTVEAVESFPSESPLSGNGAVVPDVSSVTEPENGAARPATV